jgi:hypothetical protein
VLRMSTIPAILAGVLPIAGAASCFEVALEACKGTIIAVSDDRAFLRSFAEV